MGIIGKLFTAIVPVTEPHEGPTWFGVIRNVRPVTQAPPQAAPDPIRYGDFWADGKPPAFAASHMPFWVGFNIAGIESVMEDSFTAGKHVLYAQPSVNRGYQIALVDRANIYRPEARAFGSEFVIDPYQSQIDPRYLTPER